MHQIKFVGSSKIGHLCMFLLLHTLQIQYRQFAQKPKLPQLSNQLSAMLLSSMIDLGNHIAICHLWLVFCTFLLYCFMYKQQGKIDLHLHTLKGVFTERYLRKTPDPSSKSFSCFLFNEQNKRETENISVSPVHFVQDLESLYLILSL